MVAVQTDMIGRLGWIIVMVLLIAGAVALSGLLLSDYRLYASMRHINEWIGEGDLIVTRQNAVYSSGEAVLVSQISSEEARGIAWVVGYEAGSPRVIVVHNSGIERRMSVDRILGRVYWSLSGAGDWLIWLSSPWRLVAALILPTAGLSSLEIKNLRKKWSLEKPAYRLTTSSS